MSRLVLAEAAVSDLDEIEDYITNQDGPLRAASVIARLNRSLQILAYMPGIGRRRTKVAGRHVLFHPVSSWVVLYTILPAKDGIYVRRIVHGRRDLKRVLRRPR